MEIFLEAMLVKHGRPNILFMVLGNAFYSLIIKKIGLIYLVPPDKMIIICMGMMNKFVWDVVMIIFRCL